MPLANDFTSTGFSALTAYYLAKVSDAAYSNTLTTVAAELGIPADTRVSGFGDLSAFVADLDSALLLAFRGTDNIANWLSDSNIIQVRSPEYPGKVHRGFAAALDQMWPGLVDHLSAGRPLWVTGHSLGGALATLAGERLLSEGRTVSAVYTYGSPRVGDLDFYTGYRAVNYRVVNNDDIVPHVPLETLLIGGGPFALQHFAYKHVGSLKYLDRHGKLGEGMSGWDAKKNFILNGLLRRGGTPWPQAVEDHHIANYITALGTNL